MSAKFKDITFTKAKIIITKEFFLKKSITNKGTLAGGIRWGIFHSIVVFFFSWWLLVSSGVKNAPMYPLLIFIIPVNLMVVLIISIIRKKELFLFKNAVSSGLVWLYLGMIALTAVFIPRMDKFLKHGEVLKFMLYFFFLSVSIWIIIYTYRNFVQDIYESYGLITKKSKFNKIYRKVAYWIIIIGIILAYAFRNIPGSHGSTAPQWLQYIGVIGIALIFCFIPGYIFLNDIISGLLIKKYYKEFKNLYDEKKEDDI